MKSLLFRYASSILTPIMLIFSLLVLYRGHNLPGGGFVGGLIAASAYVMFFFGHGGEVARQKLPLKPNHITSAGLIIALLAGCIPLFSGKVFLKGLWTEIAAADFSIKVGTPMLFDIGVYLVVAGTTIMIFYHLKD